MAEYREVIKQFKRMCKSYGTSCDSCPVNEQRGIFYCWRWITEEPVKAEELIMNWAKNNPPITNRIKFAEVFGCDPITLDIWNQKGGNWLDEEYKEPKDE